MAVTNSGQISISALVAEFGGSAPHTLSEYYRGGGEVPNVSQNNSVPTSGQVKLSNFYSSTIYNSGSANYSSPGTSSFTVPDGVLSLTVSASGAGGGGGGFYGNGDTHAGGGGGAGGYFNNYTVTVTPLEVLTLIVGDGGKRGGTQFNGNWINYGTNNNSFNGGTGGSTHIKRGSTNLLIAYGGAGAPTGGPGDNCPGLSGAGGSTSSGGSGGGAGGTVNCNRNSYGATPGGTNGLSGSAGHGGASHNSSNFMTVEGNDGVINLVW